MRLSDPGCVTQWWGDSVLQKDVSAQGDSGFQETISQAEGKYREVAQTGCQCECVMPPHFTSLTLVHRLAVTFTGLCVTHSVSVAVAVCLIGSFLGWHSTFVCVVCSLPALMGTHDKAIISRPVNLLYRVISDTCLPATHTDTQFKTNQTSRDFITLG